MTWLRNALLATVLFGSLVGFAPCAVMADDYWDGYWGWYDNTYSPGYGRYYTNSPPYNGGTYYGGGYYPQPYYGGYYNPPYYGRQYGLPRAGYTDYGWGRGAVNVGPLQFGWR